MHTLFLLYSKKNSFVATYTLIGPMWNQQTRYSWLKVHLTVNADFFACNDFVKCNNKKRLSCKAYFSNVNIVSLRKKIQRVGNTRFLWETSEAMLLRREIMRCNFQRRIVSDT